VHFIYTTKIKMSNVNDDDTMGGLAARMAQVTVSMLRTLVQAPAYRFSAEVDTSDDDTSSDTTSDDADRTPDTVVADTKAVKEAFSLVDARAARAARAAARVEDLASRKAAKQVERTTKHQSRLVARDTRMTEFQLKAEAREAAKIARKAAIDALAVAKVAAKAADRAVRADAKAVELGAKLDSEIKKIAANKVGGSARYADRDYISKKHNAPLLHRHAKAATPTHRRIKYPTK